MMIPTLRPSMPLLTRAQHTSVHASPSLFGHTLLPAHAAIARARLAALPLSFEANRGQTDRRVRFLSRGPGYLLFLTNHGVVLSLVAHRPQRHGHGLVGALSGAALTQTQPRVVSVVRMTFAGVSSTPTVQGDQQLPGVANYFIGRNVTHWQRHVPTYQRVTYHNLYPGIALTYYGHAGHLEYDWTVEPGAHPSAIDLVVTGDSGAAVDAAGNLVLHTVTGDLTETAPVAYQFIRGVRQSIAVQYVQRAQGHIGFALGRHDVHSPLVIDPALVYSTLLGGSNNDAGEGIVVDGSGDTYITGYTNSPTFPTTSGAYSTTLAGGYDAFVTKINPSGSGLVYSTYLGGQGDSQGQGIAVDEAGNAFLMGQTNATDFATTANAAQSTYGGGSSDLFVTELNPSGSTVLYSTYLGGSGADEVYGKGNDLALDSNDNVYITGRTASPDYLTTPSAAQTTYGGGRYDAVVTKLNPNAIPSASSLVYSTYLGGSNDDEGYGIAVDSAGNAYVTGETASTNFPTTAGVLQGSLTSGADAFVTKINPSGTGFVYSTYLGGPIGGTAAWTIALDTAGNAFVAGGTNSPQFPVTPGALHHTAGANDDAYVSKLNATGSELLYSATWGGSGSDDVFGLATDGVTAYTVGTTNSSDFPTSPGAPQASFGGVSDAFVTALNSTGTALTYSTYLGGAAQDDGAAIALDATDQVHITGDTYSGASFPTTPGAFDATPNGADDAFVAMIGSGVSYHDLAAYTYQMPLTITGGSVGVSGSTTVPVLPTGTDYVVHVHLTGSQAAQVFNTATYTTSATYNGVPFADVTVWWVDAMGLAHQLDIDTDTTTYGAWSPSNITLWFRLQQPLGAAPATDSSYVLAWGNSTPAVMRDWSNIYPFQDDFEASTLDTTKWIVHNVGVAVSGGSLTLTNPGGPQIDRYLQGSTNFGAGYAVSVRGALADFSGDNAVVAGWDDPYLAFDSNDFFGLAILSGGINWHNYGPVSPAMQTYTVGTLPDGTYSAWENTDPPHHFQEYYPAVSAWPLLDVYGSGPYSTSFEWAKVRPWIPTEPTVSAGAVVVRSSGNLVQNPGFESPLGGSQQSCAGAPQSIGNWFAFAQTNGMLPTEVGAPNPVHSGVQSGQASTPGSPLTCNGDYLYQDFPSFSAAASYTFSSWVYPVQGEQQISLLFGWPHGGGTLAGQTGMFVYPDHTAFDAWGQSGTGPRLSYNTWHQLTIVADASTLTSQFFIDGILAGTTVRGTPVSTSGATILLGQGNGYDPSADHFYYDDVSLVRGSVRPTPQPGTWTPTGLMTTGRAQQTATLLPNGKVLVAGGVDSSGNVLSAAELYDPTTGTWEATGSMITARWQHTATLLPDGQVLATGGVDDPYGSSLDDLSSAELYNPSSGTWTATGSMNEARSSHTATLLSNGMVLVAGGWCGGETCALNSAELYDPATGAWTTTGPMATARAGHTATLLPDGQVLAAGGETCCTYSSLASAEIYNPSTGTWTATGSMGQTRNFHTATLLPSGTVLVSGGFTGASPNQASVSGAELYSPSTGTWASTGSMNVSRGAHTATSLPSGQILVAGGDSCTSSTSCTILASAELYDPSTGAWTPTNSMATARWAHTATLLPNGQVLAMGGNSLTCCGWSGIGSAELYTPLITAGSAPNNQMFAPGDDTCPCAHHSTTHPFDTRSGNLWQQITDLALSSNGPALSWSRTYNSQTTGTISGTLGAGWQDPYTAHLVTNGQDVTITNGSGDTVRFQGLGNGQFQPYPGVYATLVAANGLYTETLTSQETHTFNSAGQLVGMADAQGRPLLLAYNAQQQLASVTDAINPQRALILGYSADGSHITSIGDPSGRSVQYGYDPAGDLTSVTDVMGRTTLYTYTNHLLTDITNPLGQLVEHDDYDGATPPRVSHQILQDGTQVSVQYDPSSTTMTTTAPDGHQDVEQDLYDPTLNTITGIIHNGVPVQGTQIADTNLAPAAETDGNGNTTLISADKMGQPTSVTDALGDQTTASYNAQEQPITTTDALGRETVRIYDANNVISQTTGITTGSLGQTTVYTYNVRYPGLNLLEEEQAPNGVVTRYDYDPLTEQLITTTVGVGSPQPEVSTNGYDALGRVVTATIGAGTSQQRINVTVYNADNTISATIQNYTGSGVFDPAHPDQNATTAYGYDALGRQVWVRDPLGHFTVTHYNALGQTDWTARNYSALDQSGLPAIGATPPAYDPVVPDQNVATLYGYDGLGRQILVTQTGILTGTFDPVSQTFSAATTRVTRTEYDPVSGYPVTVTLNYQPTLPVGVYPDVNVQTITEYDTAGNVTLQRDALGRWTYTQYDALNRPVTTTINYEDGNPLTVAPADQSWTDGHDTDLIAVTHYNPDGSTSQQIENYVTGIFSSTQPITDRITQFGYDSVGRLITTTVNYDPNPLDAGRTDLNRTSVTAYDPVSGQTIGQRDALGRWVAQQYDLLGRPDASIQNCTAGGVPAPQGCGPSGTDSNALTAQGYDALGQTVAVTDPLGHETTTTFDGLGRAIATTQNTVPSVPASVDTNVTTRMAFDALGETTVTTDAVGAATSYSYNGLGQTVAMTDALGHVTYSGYDGTGTLRWRQTPDGRYTVYSVDGLGRVVATTQNYTTTAPPAGSTDTNLTTQSVYDAAGRQIETIDPAGRVISNTYDLRDHLIQTIQNYVPPGSPCLAPPCNVTTTYTYDRAGDRVATTDPLGNTTLYSYDAAGEQVQVTDALGGATALAYDPAGRTISTTDQMGRLALSLYDGLDNLISQTTGISAGALGATTISTYTLGQLTDQQAPNGAVTHYDYDGLNRVITTTLGPGTPQQEVTASGYDADGRTVTTTVGVGTSAQRSDVTLYNPDGTVGETIQNDTGTGTFDPAQPDQNVPTTYSYDALGRQVATTDALGHVDVTHYDGAGRTDWTLRDLAPVTITAGQPVLPSAPPAFDPAHPDQNVTTLYAFDVLGQQTLLTQTGILSGTFDPASATFSAATTRTTRTEYDGLERPVTTTLNYQPAAPMGVLPDTNVQSLRQYDNAGNVTWQRDALGRWTYTQYDALNRPVTSTINYEDGNPLTVAPADQSWTNGSDTDIIGVTRYNADGSTAATIQNYVTGVFTASAPITDQITLDGYDGQGHPVTTTVNADPNPADAARPDLNRISLTSYNLLNEMVGQRDALGRWTALQYDVLGRQVSTTRNCTDTNSQPVDPSAGACGPFTTAAQDRNVTDTTHYDVFDRPFETVDALGHVTHTDYDGLSRSVDVIQNTVPGAAPSADTNVSAQTAYNALGWTTVTTDAVGAPTTYGYDGLGQTVAVTDALSRTTRSGYDGTGTLRWSETADGRFTVYTLDGLGRVITTTENYSPTAPALSSDANLSSGVVYDAAGRQIETVDPAGRVISNTYDLRDHLVQAIQNYVPPGAPCLTPPCNVTTTYTYDRAGNRLTMTDPLDHTTQYSYDATNEQTAVTDPLGRTTRQDYDSGGRLVARHDPRGPSDDLTYSYDGLDRLISTAAVSPSAQSLAVPITATYDALDRRLSLGDGTGTTLFSYDNLSRMTGVNAPTTGQISYGYDADGHRTQLTYPDNTMIGYSYDAAGELHTVTQAGQTAPLASYNYDLAGRLTGLARGNGTTTAYSYDGANRLRDVATYRGSALQSDFSAAVNQLGQITALTETGILSGGTTAGPSNPPTDGANGSAAHGARLASPLVAALPPQAPTIATGVSAAPAHHGVMDLVGRYIGALVSPRAPPGQAGVQGSTARAGRGLSRSTGSTGPRVEAPGRGIGSVVLGVSQSTDRPRATRTPRPKPTATATAAPTRTPTHTPRPTATRTPTRTPPASATPTHTPRATRTPTATPTRTPKPTRTPTATPTRVRPTPTATSTQPAPTATMTKVPATATPTSTITPLPPGATASPTPTATPTASSTATPTATVTPSSTDTASPTPTATATNTSSPTPTATATSTATPIPSPTATPTQGPRSLTYAYDGLNRLVGVTETPGTVYAYTYDLAGNRTAVFLNGSPSQQMGYDAANEVVTATTPQGTEAYSYDAAGNLTTDGSALYSYDALNRLTVLTTTVSGQSTGYSYNGDNALVAETAGGAATWYAQDLAAPLSQVLQVGSASGTPTDYLYGVARLAGIPAYGGTGSASWYVTDLQGSVRYTQGDAGLPGGVNPQLINYDPFGSVESNRGGTGPQPQLFGYRGEQQDIQTGLINLRARQYNPAAGQFLTRDPLEQQTGQPYAYAGGDPVNNADPNGLSWVATNLTALPSGVEGALIERAKEHFASTARKDLSGNSYTILDIGSSEGHADIVDLTGGYKTIAGGYGNGIVADGYVYSFVPAANQESDYNGYPRYAYAPTRDGSVGVIHMLEEQSIADALAIVYGYRTFPGQPHCIHTNGRFDLALGTLYPRHGTDVGGGVADNQTDYLVQDGIRYAIITNSYDEPVYGGGFIQYTICTYESRGPETCQGPAPTPEQQTTSTPGENPCQGEDWLTCGVDLVVFGGELKNCNRSDAGACLRALGWGIFTVAPVGKLAGLAVKGMGTVIKIAVRADLDLSYEGVRTYFATRSARIFSQLTGRAVDATPDEVKTLLNVICPFHCFPAGTAVATPRGLTAIEKLHVGDLVLSEDPTTGKIDKEHILALITRPLSVLMAVTLSDGSTLKVTTNHLFWVDAGSKHKHAGWVESGHLVVGELLRTASRKDVSVVRLRWHTGRAVVYTLTVIHDHTFFVGSARVLVHNATCLTQDVVRELIHEDPDRWDHNLKHALEWFGYRTRKVTDVPASLLSQRQLSEWDNLLTTVGSNSDIFLWDSRGTPTIAHLGFVDGKWLVVQFARKTDGPVGHGLLVTAFIPSGSELARMQAALKG